MATLSNNDIARAIYFAVKGKSPHEQSQMFKRTAQFLNKHRLISKTGEILSRLQKIINEDEGKVVALISSKKKLDEHEKKELSRALSKRYRGKTVVIEEKIDEKLIGGFKIEAEDEQIDVTLRNKISQLQEYLIK